MNRQPNQNGFSIVLVIIAILLLGGGVGWYVWNRNTSSNKNADETSTPTQTNNQTAEDPYSGWKIFTNEAEKISFKYPADWQAETIDMNGRDTLELHAPVSTIQNSEYRYTLSFWVTDTSIFPAGPTSVNVTKVEPLITLDGKHTFYSLLTAVTEVDERPVFHSLSDTGLPLGRYEGNWLGITTHEKNIITFSGSYLSNPNGPEHERGLGYFTSEEFSQQKEFEITKQIFKSIIY